MQFFKSLSKVSPFWNIFPLFIWGPGNSAVDYKISFCMDMAMLNTESKWWGCLIADGMHSTLLCLSPTPYWSKRSNIAFNSRSIRGSRNVPWNQDCSAWGITFFLTPFVFSYIFFTIENGAKIQLCLTAPQSIEMSCRSYSNSPSFHVWSRGPGFPHS